MTGLTRQIRRTIGNPIPLPVVDGLDGSGMNVNGARVTSPIWRIKGAEDLWAVNQVFHLTRSGITVPEIGLNTIPLEGNQYL